MVVIMDDNIKNGTYIASQRGPDIILYCDNINGCFDDVREWCYIRWLDDLSSWRVGTLMLFGHEAVYLDIRPNSMIDLTEFKLRWL